MRLCADVGVLREESRGSVLVAVERYSEPRVSWNPN